MVLCSVDLERECSLIMTVPQSGGGAVMDFPVTFSIGVIVVPVMGCSLRWKEMAFKAGDPYFCSTESFT